MWKKYKVITCKNCSNEVLSNPDNMMPIHTILNLKTQDSIETETHLPALGFHQCTETVNFQFQSVFSSRKILLGCSDSVCYWLQQFISTLIPTSSTQVRSLSLSLYLFYRTVPLSLVPILWWFIKFSFWVINFWVCLESFASSDH